MAYCSENKTVRIRLTFTQNPFPVESNRNLFLEFELTSQDNHRSLDEGGNFTSHQRPTAGRFFQTGRSHRDRQDVGFDSSLTQGRILSWSAFG